MKRLAAMSGNELFLELETTRIRLVRGREMREWPVERSPAGGLSEDCRSRLFSGLGEAASSAGRAGAAPVLVCSLPASGLSLRRWTVPGATSDVGGMLRLRIEAEFPLPPEALVWGWQTLGTAGDGTLEVLVAAVRRTALEEWHRLLTDAGFDPIYIVSSLARAALIPAHSGLAMGVHLGATHSEWIHVDAQGPARLGVFLWGEAEVAERAGERLGLTGEATLAMAARLARGDGEPVEATRLEEAVRQAFLALQEAGSVAATGSGPFVTGGPLVSWWQGLGDPAGAGSGLAHVLHLESGEALPAAWEGWRRGVQKGAPPPLRLGWSDPGEGPTGLTAGWRGSSRTAWVTAGALLLAVLVLPQFEAWWFRPRLEARLAAIRARRHDLQMIDRESGFLRHLRASQMPHLETLLVIGRCAPRGARIDSLSLNRKGEVALRMSLRQPPEVIEFRRKLVECGFFSTVAVEEQSPSPDRQKLMVRLSAVLAPAAAREGLAILSTNEPPANPSPVPTAVGGGRPPMPPRG